MFFLHLHSMSAVTLSVTSNRESFQIGRMLRRHLLESREQSPGPLVDDGRNAHAHSVVGVGNHEEPLLSHCEEPSPAVGLLSTSESLYAFFNDVHPCYTRFQ